jgi:hypothetical protein
MLAFDDGALARLMIAATAIARFDRPSNGETPQHPHRGTTEPARRGERQHRGRNAFRPAALAHADRDKAWLRKTPPGGSGAQTIRGAGVSGSIAERRFIRLRSTP